MWGIAHQGGRHRRRPQPGRPRGEKSGTDFTATADACLARSLRWPAGTRSDSSPAVSTGYGRKNVSFAEGTRTEIGCHAKGCYSAFPQAITIIDIGGQDNKVIQLDAAGRRTSFKMNRKCAAGTGAFLEEMSRRLDIPLEAMNDLARPATEMIKLGSFCTVFSATEVFENIRHGKRIDDIVKGIFYSMAPVGPRDGRVDRKKGHDRGVVAHNPYLVKMMAERSDGRSGAGVTTVDRSTWRGVVCSGCGNQHR